MKPLRLLWPHNWLKLGASTTALWVQAIRLSEMSDDRGWALPDQRAEWLGVARQVSFEAKQVRRHAGFL